MAIPFVYAASPYWVDDPLNCPATDATEFPGQDCAPNNICGESSDIAQCHDGLSISAPSGTSSSNTDQDGGGFDGGYLINCFVSADGSAPFCDNGGSFWCDRNSTCYSTQFRDTTCNANVFGESSCGSCRSGYNDCDADGGICEIQNGASCGTNAEYSGCSGSLGNCICEANHLDCDASGASSGNGCEIGVGDSCGFGTGTYGSSCFGSGGNCISSGTTLDCNNDDGDDNEATCNGGSDGCEITVGGACTVGSLSGTYANTCSAGNGLCVIDKSYFETGTETSYSSDDPLLWGVQYGGGDLANFTNGDTNISFAINNSGCLIFPDGTTQCTSGGGSLNSSEYVPYQNATQNVDLNSQNITTTGTGFFSALGSLLSRITNLFVGDIYSNGSLYQPVYPTDDGLVLYIPFSEPNGSTQYDRGPYGYDGTQTGNVLCNATNGKYGNGCEFTSGASYVEVVSNKNSNIEFGNDFTISMWIKTSSDGVGLIHKSDGDIEWELNEKVFYISDGSEGGVSIRGTVGFAGNGNDFIKGNTVITDDDWHHIAVTWNDDAGTGTIYIDGINDTRHDGYNGNSDTGTYVRIGEGNNNSEASNDFIGSIDEVRIYSRTLSPEEIRTHYLDRSSHGTIKADDFKIINTTGSEKLRVDGSGVVNASGDILVGGDVNISGNLQVNGNITGGSPVKVVGGLDVDGNTSLGGFVNVTGDLHMNDGSITHNSPVLIRDGLRLEDSDGNKLFDIEVQGISDHIETEAPESLNGSLIFETWNITNPSNMQVVFWDYVTSRPTLILNQGGSQRASVFDRSVLIGKELGNATVDENYTSCEGFNLIDCNTTGTGADLGVEDDIEAKGSVYANSFLVSSDVDILIDADGSNSTTSGEAGFIADEDSLVGVEASDNLCSDSLVSPTIVFLLTNETTSCDTTDGSITSLIGNVTVNTAYIEVNSSWAFQDTVVVDGIYTDGEDLYIDTVNPLSFDFGGIVIPSSTSANITDALHQYSDRLYWDGEQVITGVRSDNGTITIQEDGGGPLVIPMPLVLSGGNVDFGDKVKFTNETTFEDHVTLSGRDPGSILFLEQECIDFLNGTIYCFGEPFVSEDNDNLYYDWQNNRVGIGTNTPDHTFTVDAASAFHQTALFTYLAEGIIPYIGTNNGLRDSGSLFWDNTNGYFSVGSNASSAQIHSIGGDILVTEGNVRVTEENPRRLAGLSDATCNPGCDISDASDVFVVGDYAYVTSIGDNDLAIIDISEVNNPVQANNVQTGFPNGPSSVHVANRFAYVTSPTDNALYVYDVSEPSIGATLVGNLTDAVCDAAVGGAGCALNNVRHVFVVSNYAYVVSATDDGMAIIDVSDKTNPTHISSYFNATNLNGAYEIYVKDNIAYVTAFTGHQVTLIDVFDAENPTFLGEIVDGAGGAQLNAAQSIVVQDHYAYVLAYGDASFEIIDVEDPSNPTLLGSFDSTDCTGCNFVGTSDLDIAGDYAYITVDVNDELVVVDISNKSNPTYAGLLLLNTTPVAIDIVGKHAYLAGRANEEFQVIDISGVKSPSATFGSVATDDVSVAGILSVPGKIVAKEIEASLSGFRLDQSSEGGIFYGGKGGLVSQSSNELRWDRTAGYLGVGTSSPSELVHVNDGNVLLTAGEPAVIGIIDDGTCDTEFNTTGCPLAGAKDVYVKDDYAYVASETDDGFAIVDISYPSSPTYIDGQFDSSDESLDGTNAIYVQGDYAYVLSGIEDAFSVYDISDPTTITWVATINDTECDADFIGGCAINNPQDIVVRGHYAYVSSAGDHGVSIFDVATPQSPEHVISIFDNSTYGPLGLPLTIDIQDDILYVAASADDALNIIDVVNPNIPIPLGEIFDNASLSLDGLFGVKIRGHYAYVTSTVDLGFTVIDIKDTTNPIVVSNFTNASCTGNCRLDTPGHIALAGDYAYITVEGSNDGIEVINIENVNNLSHVAFLADDADSLLSEPSGIHIIGKYAYVSSEGEDGLTVVDIHGLKTPSAEIGTLEVDDITVRENIFVEGLLDSYEIVAGLGGITSYGDVFVRSELMSVDAGNVVITEKAPFEVTVYTDSECDSDSGSDCTITNSQAIETDSDGDYVFVSSITDNGITKIYVEDEDDPEPVAIILDTASDHLADIVDMDMAVIYESEVNDFTDDNSDDSDVEVLIVVSSDDDAVTVLKTNDEEDTDSDSDFDEMSVLSDITDSECDAAVGGAGCALDDPQTLLTWAEVDGYFVLVGSDVDNGVAILDVSNASNIKHITSIFDDSSTRFQDPKAIEKVNDHIFVASGTEDAVTVIDVSQPQNPEVVDVIEDGVDGAQMDNPLAFEVRGEFMYIASNNASAVEVYDISDPANATYVTRLQSTSTLGEINDLERTGDILLAGTDSGIVEIDVTVPSNPTITGMIKDDGAGSAKVEGGDGGTSSNIAHVSSLKIDRGRVYAVSATENALTILKFRNIKSPAGIFDNLYIRGDASIDGSIIADSLDIDGDLSVDGEIETLRLQSMQGIDSDGDIDVDGDVFVDMATLRPLGSFGENSSNELSIPVDVVVDEDSEYAYVIAVGDDSLTVLDIRDTDDPVVVAFENDATCDVQGHGNCALDGPSEITRWDDFLFIAAGDDDGISVFDVSDEGAKPQHRSSLLDASCDDGYDSGDPIEGCALSDITGIDVENEFVYTVNDPVIGEEEGLSILEYNELGELIYRNMIEDDASSMLGGGGGIDVEEGIAYIIAAADDGFTIMDVNDPDNPNTLSSMNDAALTGAIDLTDVLYFDDNVYLLSGADDQLSVIDVSDLENPIEGTVITGSSLGTSAGFDNPQHLERIGDRLVVTAKDGDAILLFDISDPENPRYMTTLFDNEALELDGANGIGFGDATLVVVGEEDNGTQLFDLSIVDASVGQIDHVFADDISALESEFNVLQVNERTYLDGLVYINGRLVANDDIVQNLDGEDISQIGSLSDSGSTLLLGAADIVLAGGLAYVASQSDDGLSIVDVSDPENMTEIASVSDLTGRLLDGANGVAVSPDTAVVIGYNDSGITIFDISDSRNPVIIGQISGIECNEQQSDCPLDSPLDVEIDGDYVYLGSEDEDGIAVIDISDPAHPTFVSSITNTECDTAGGGNVCALNNPIDIEIDGDYLYAADNADGGIAVLDITDPENIQHVASIFDAGRELAGASSIAIQGNYLVATSDIDTAVIIIDISDPTNPVYLDDLEDTDCDDQFPSGCALSGATDAVIVGDYAYVVGNTNGQEGITLIDISNKSNIKVVDTIFESGGGVLLDDVSSIAASAGHIFVTAAGASESGIAVFDMSGISGTSGTFNYLSADNVDVANGLEIGKDLIVHEDATVDGVLTANEINVEDGGLTSQGNIIVDGTIVHDNSYFNSECDYDAGGSGCGLDNPIDVKLNGNYLFVSSDDVADGDSITIIDVTDPTDPEFVSAIFDGGGNDLTNPKEIAVSDDGNYVYVTAQGGNDLTVVNVTNRTSPTQVGTIAASSCHPNCALDGVDEIFVVGTTVYVGAPVDQGFGIYSVSNPASPTHQGSLFDDGSNNLLDIEGIYVKDGHAYVISGASNTLDVIDVGNPFFPTYDTTLTDDGSTIHLNGPVAITGDDRYLYVLVDGTSKGIMVFDAVTSNSPTALSFLLNIGTNELSGGNDLVLQGNDLYVTGDDYITHIDVTDPSNPVFLDTIADSREMALDGGFGIATNEDNIYTIGLEDDGITVFGKKKIEAKLGDFEDIKVSSGIALQAGNPDTTNDTLYHSNNSLYWDGNRISTFSTNFTPGSVIFADNVGELGQSGGQFFWDNTNNRLGIRSDTPSAALTVAGGIHVQSSTPDTTNDTLYHINNSLWWDENRLVSVNGSGTGGQTPVFINNDTVEATSALYVNISSGNVGIGTVNPTSVLTVNGSADVTGSLYQSAYPSDDNLLLYLPFSENGSTQYDRSPYGYDGVVTGMNCTNENGKYGSGCVFNGTNAVILSTEDAAFSIDEFTIEAWIRRDNDTGNVEHIITNEDGTADGWRLYVSSADIVGCQYNSNNVFSTTNITVGSWYHIACIANETNVSVYVNGHKEGSIAQVGSINESTDAIIGANTNLTLGWNGAIDEVRIYERVLGVDELRTHYLRGGSFNSLGAITADTFRLIDTSGNVDFIIDSGKVGIGTTSPNAALEVNGSASVTGNTTIIGDLNVTGTSYLRDVTLTSDNITVNNILSRDGNITFYNNESNQTVVITSEGNVFIGTNESLSIVNVSGNVSADYFIGDGSKLTGVASSGDILWTNSSGNATFTSSRVGINTTTPQNTLHVVGDLNTTTLILGSDSITDITGTGLTVSSDALTLSLSNGSGTTANGAAVDLGGTITADMQFLPDIDDAYSINFGNGPTARVTEFGVEGNTIFFISEDGSGGSDDISTLQFGINEVYLNSYEANPGDRDGNQIYLTKDLAEFGFYQSHGLINNPLVQGFSINSSGLVVIDDLNRTGLVYVDDYGANFTNRSIPDVEWVTTQISGISSGGNSIWTNSSGNATFTSGNVGIGTSAPNADLTVEKSLSDEIVDLRTYNNDANGIAHIYTGANGGGHINLISNSNASAYLGISASTSGIATEFSDMVIATGSGGTATERIRIKDSGEVGIGDTAADYALEIATNTSNGYFGITNSSDGDLLEVNSDGTVSIGNGSISDSNVRLSVEGGYLNWKWGDHQIAHNTPGGDTGLIFNFDQLGSYSRFDMKNTPSGTEANRYFSLAFNGQGHNGLIIRQDGRIGLGTASPATRLVLNGTVSNYADGPHVETYTSDDANNPVFQTLSYTSDNIGLSFGAYYNGSNWVSSDAGSNFQIYKFTDALRFRYDSGITAGNTLTWNEGFILNTDGEVGIGTTNPSGPLEVRTSNSTTEAPILVLTSQDGRNLRILQPNTISNDDPFTLVTNNALTFRVDSTNALSIDSAGEVGIGTEFPLSTLDAVGVYSDTVGGTNRDLFIDNTGTIGYVSSSERYKSNITNLSDSDWIYDLRPVSFVRDEDGVFDIGLIAEEVHEVNPDLVSYDLFELMNGSYVKVDDRDDHEGYIELDRNMTSEDVWEVTLGRNITVERTNLTTNETYNTTELETDTKIIAKLPETISYSDLTVPLLKEVQGLREDVDSLAGGNYSIREEVIADKDAVGKAIITVNNTKVSVTFENPYIAEPIITVTPIGLPQFFYGVDNVTTQGFDIVISESQKKEVTFNWHTFALQQEEFMKINNTNETKVNITNITKNNAIPSKEHQNLNTTNESAPHEINITNETTEVPIDQEENTTILRDTNASVEGEKNTSTSKQNTTTALPQNDSEETNSDTINQTNTDENEEKTGDESEVKEGEHTFSITGAVVGAPEGENIIEKITKFIRELFT